MLDYIVLGIVSEQAMTGYDIQKCIENGIGMFYKASYGSIYPILSKLLKKEFVTCIDEVQGKRVKKNYKITAAGKEEFLNWLTQEDRGSMEVFMAKVFFLDQLPMQLASEKINRYEDTLNAYCEKLKHKNKEFEQLPNRDTYYYKLSTLYYGIYKLQTAIQWCKMVKNRVELKQNIRPMEGENVSCRR